MRTLSDLLKTLARWGAITLAIAVLLFFAAGTTHIFAIRVYIAIFSFFQLVAMLFVDPGLARERSQPSVSGTQSSLRFASGFLFLVTLTVSAFDVGHVHLGGGMHPGEQICSFVLFVAAMSLQTWAMAVNPFFSPEIRLQTERGHSVIACGPYRFLRHPGYLAMLISVPASALAMGSWLGLLCAATFDLVILRRVCVEDHFLRETLPGYPEYAHSVPGGLLPQSLLAGFLIGFVLGFVAGVVAGKLIPLPLPNNMGPGITEPVIFDPNHLFLDTSCLGRLLPTAACIETRTCVVRLQDLEFCEN